MILFWHQLVIKLTQINKDKYQDRKDYKWQKRVMLFYLCKQVQNKVLIYKNYLKKQVERLEIKFHYQILQKSKIY